MRYDWSMPEFTREIHFQPAYDKRTNDPKTNCGIGSVAMRWILKGPKGAIQFVVLTDWNLPHVAKELASKGYVSQPMPTDIGYHSPHPMYEGQAPMDGKCDVLGGTCYYDGSSLRADEPFRLLLEQGHEAVWRYMEGDYRARFEEPDAERP